MTLHYREYGQAEQNRPVMVLMHGLFGSSANWGSIAKYLADRYTVLVPDLRNHGQSLHDSDTSYAAMASDVLAMLDENDIPQAYFVGHSMGGKVAMTLALQAPDYVAGIAVVDMSPVAYGHGMADIFSAFDAVDLSAISSRKDADRMMQSLVDNSGIRAFLLQNLYKTAEGWRWRANLSALKDGYCKIRGFELSGETVYSGLAHFIYGDQSDYVLPEYHETIYRLFPHAQLCSVEGAGHWVYAEKPEGFRRCFDRFCDLAD